MSGERCFIPECNAIVPNDLLMCRDHWVQVPPEVKREVYRTFNDLRAWPSKTTRQAYYGSIHRAREAVQGVRHEN